MEVRAMMSRPNRNEYADFYANYISLVPEGPIEEFLLQQWDELVAFLQAVSEDEASQPYAPGKWSIKQVLGHLCDTERVMSYRMMRFARGDTKELQGFEQDDYVAAGDFNSRVRHDLMVEFKNIRGSSIALVGSIGPEAEMRTGVANGKTVSVRALAYIIAGHAQNHLNLLRDRAKSVGSD
jgi:DinB superfamily